MSSPVRDAIAEGIAEVERAADDPVEPFGWGREWRCTLDIDARFASVDPFDPEAIANALIRRLDCPRGQLPDDPDYGIDVVGYCNGVATAAEIRALANAVRSEARKDDRIEDVSVRVTPDDLATTIAVAVAFVPADPRTGGPFSATLAVTSAGVILEAIE